MTLTPSSVRADLKCGKGAISKGEKCHKGPASKASLTENVLKYGGVIGAVGGLAYGMSPKANDLAAMSTMHASIGAVASGVAMEGARTKNRSKQMLATSVAASNLGAAALTGYGASLSGRFNRQSRNFQSEFNRGQAQSNRTYNRAWENPTGSRTQGSGQTGNSRRSMPNTATPNPFQDLGVPESASDAQIRKQWLKLAKANHPDAGGDTEKAAKINAAYQEIMRRRGKLDSIYADGFDIDWGAITL